MPAAQAPVRIAGIPVALILKKAATLIVVGVIFGWIYAWASPRFFPRDVEAGIGYGMAHGALMPMALPSLLMGQNVEIYDSNNSGRLYKIGYIIGINVCGIVFFGSAFLRPKPRQPAQETPEGST